MTSEAQASTTATAARTSTGTRLWARTLAMLIWVGLLALWTAIVGIPNDTILVLLFGWAGTIAWNIEAPARQHLAFLRDWWLPVALLTLYFYTRGLTDEIGIPAHYQFPIDVDRWLGGGVTPTERLQDAWCGHPCSVNAESHWFELYFTTVYASHFLVGLSMAVILWVRNRRSWKIWMSCYVGLNLSGLIVFIVYPMAPPWMASRDGYLGPVQRLTSRGWENIGLQRVNVILDHVGNPVAAMPSLHFGTSFLVCLYGLWRLRSKWRFLLLLYPLSMGVVLPYYGEHYVIDEIAGGLLAAAVVLVARWYWNRHPELPAQPDAEHVPAVHAVASDVRE